MKTQHLQLLAIAIAAVTLQACGSSTKNYNEDDSSLSSASSSQATSSDPISSDSASSVAIEKTAAQLYIEQCSGCHGTSGNGNTPIGASRDLAALTTYISNNMPQGDPSKCIDSCASDVAAYIIGGYDMPTATIPTPIFKLADSNIASSYKVVGPFNSLTSAEGETAIVSHEDWQWLYTASADQPLHSLCNTEACLANWQPVLAEKNAAIEPPFSVIARDDDHYQITLFGMPTYIKTSGDKPPANNPSWPLASNTPFTSTNNWLTANGHLWTQNANGDSWADLTERAVYIKTSAGECIDNCLNNWPALLAPANAVTSAPYSLITRTGTDKKQWAYQGQGLYLFGADSASEALGATIEGWQRASLSPITWRESAIGKGLFIDGQASIWTKQADNWTADWQNVHNRALYTFSNDGDFNTDPDTATLGCIADCAVTWPPLMASPNSFAQGSYSLIARGDNQQWAWNGKPLYLYSNDNAGQTTGHKDEGPWTLAGWSAATTPAQDSTPSDSEDYSY